MASRKIDEHEIRIHADGDGALAGDAKSAGWSAGNSEEIRSRVRLTAMITAIEQHGESRLHPGDTTPCRAEIARFHFGRRGRMIGRDDVNRRRRAPASTDASCSARVAQRRRALRDRAEPLDVFFGKEEIMRTRLDGDIGSPGAGFSGQQPRRGRS